MGVKGYAIHLSFSPGNGVLMRDNTPKSTRTQGGDPIADYIRADTRLPAYLPYPRFLLKMEISQTAKLLYSLLLDRSTLSQKNKWLDDEGRIYIIYPIAEIAEILDKGSTTIKGALNELDTAGLLERERGGFSAPNRLYVKVPPVPQVQFSDQLMAGSPPLIEPENRPTDGQKTDLMMVGKPSPRHIYMDGMPKPSNEAIYYIVDTIQSSIQSNQQISFQYYEYLPTKEKVLKHQGYRYQFTPYALIWNRDHYYVVGWSEKHMKLSQFRVDRMTSVEMMDQPGHQLLGFEPAEYVQKVFGMYPDDLQMVTLFCENDVMRSIIDRFGEGVRTEVVDDDHFQAIVEVAPSPPFFGWIFTFAGKIRILKPDNVLEEMRQMASWL